MVLLPFHWGHDEVSLFFFLVVLDGLCLALLVLIIAGFVILVGRGVDMGSSRPRESASEPFFNELLGLFGYPSGSARALLAGTLPLRYCTTRFASRIPTWRLPVSGHVAWLVTALRFLVLLGMRFLVGRFTGLVVLVLVAKEFD